MIFLKRLSFTLFAVLVPICGSQHASAQNQQPSRQLRQDSQPQQQRQTGEHRIALVIGNGTYQNAKPLNNPPNDATLLAATLKKLGFEVTLGINKTQREMKQLIRGFGQRLRANGGVGLFYFAGHGVQSKGHNYLIPIDADIQTEGELEDVAVDVNYALNLMDDAQNALNIAILDACRNNPFARGFRSAQEGLAQVKAPTGTLIAYATAPDSVASDGGGNNSPYTEALTKQMEQPGVLLETVFRRVTEQVSTRTGGRQEPWVSANIKGEFYFRATVATDARVNNTANMPAASSSISEAAKEEALWDAVKDSSEPQDFRGYLTKYPNGAYLDAAQVKLRRLEAARSIIESSQPSNSQPANVRGNAPSLSLQLPRPSQKATVVQTVGVTDITITYSRPGVKGRTIWGEPWTGATEATLDNQNERPKGAPIVPWGHVWRAGANEATQFVVTDDVTINGQKLRAGSYSLHTIPTKSEWTIVFNGDANQWGSFNYNAAKDTLRVKVKPEWVAENQEWLSYSIPVVTPNSAQVVLRWEKLAVPFTVEVPNVEAAWRAKADALIAADPTNWRLPLQVAGAYASENRWDDAIAWIDKSIRVQETFENLRSKSNMLLAAGRKEEAFLAGDRAIARGKADKKDTAAFEKRLADMKTGKL
jgi:uncharacterized caspase-like protein